MRGLPLLAGLLLSCGSVFAQFYAPETEFHDQAQRLFPVELARVLAWQRNLAGESIEEVRYEVKTTEERETHWQLRWLGADGKTLRERTVSYPETLLVEGPKFYRQVLAQVCGEDWNPKAGGAADLAAGFFDGMGRGGMSRTESLRAALTLMPPDQHGLPPVAEARLAGGLVSTVAQGIGTSVSLDFVLLARAAAWLALAEAGSGTPADQLWAPVLFLAGREYQAVSLWGGRTMAEIPPAAAWLVLLNHPDAKQAFLFAAEPKARPYAMPILAAFARLDWTHQRLVSHLLVPFLGENLASACDIVPLLEDQAEFFSGYWLEMPAVVLAPALARQAWVELLRDFRPDPRDFGGYKDALDRALRAAKPAEDDEGDPSLAGLEETAPLLSLGFSQGRGPLIPVALVTARDLLNFGWESTGVQLGRREKFLRQTLGDKTRAKSFAKTVSPLVQGSRPFFDDEWDVIHTYPVERQRFQFISLEAVTSGYLVDAKAPEPIWGGPDTQSDNDLFTKRTWLLPGDACCQIWRTSQAAGGGAAVKLMHRIHAEGGRINDSKILFQLYDGKNRKSFGDTRALKPELLKSIGTTTRFDLEWALESTGADAAQRAHEWERIYWLNSEFQYRDIFFDYVQGAAYHAAGRFAGRMAERLSRADFSDRLGLQWWMLGLVQENETVMDAAMRYSAAETYTDHVLKIMDATARGDLVELGRWIDRCIEQYGPGPMNGHESVGRLREFSALLPALQTADHPDRDRALDFFLNDAEWPTFQWIIIQQFKLPPADAARFLGGADSTDPRRRPMIEFFLGDADAFRKHVQGIDFKTLGKMNQILVAYMRNVMEKKPAVELPDVYPADPTPLRKAVLDKLSAP